MTKRIHLQAEETLRTARVVTTHAPTLALHFAELAEAHSVAVSPASASFVVDAARIATALAEDAKASSVAHATRVLDRDARAVEARRARGEAHAALVHARQVVVTCFGKAVSGRVFGRGRLPESYGLLVARLSSAVAQLESDVAVFTPLSGAASADPKALAKELRDALAKLESAHAVVTRDAGDAVGKRTGRDRKAVLLRRTLVNLRRLAEASLRFVGDDGLADGLAVHHHAKVEEAPAPSPAPPAPPA